MVGVELSEQDTSRDGQTESFIRIVNSYNLTEVPKGGPSVKILNYW